MNAAAIKAPQSPAEGRAATTPLPTRQRARLGSFGSLWRHSARRWRAP